MSLTCFFALDLTLNILNIYKNMKTNKQKNVHLEPLQVANSLGNGSFHVHGVVLQLVVLLPQMLLLLHQGGVAAGQRPLVHLQQGHFTGSLSHLPPDLGRILLQSLQPELRIQTHTRKNEQTLRSEVLGRVHTWNCDRISSDHFWSGQRYS